MPRRKVPPKPIFYVIVSNRAFRPYIARSLADAIELYHEKVYRSTTRNRQSLQFGHSVSLVHKGVTLIHYVGWRQVKPQIMAALADLDDNPLGL